MSSKGRLSATTNTLQRSKANSAVNKDKKTRKHHQTVHEQEVKQLETYVKKRSEELDEEINSLRNKLKNRTLNDVVNDKSSSRRFGSSVEDASLKKVGYTSDGLTIGGKGLGKVNLDPSNLLNQARKQNSRYDSETKKLEKMKSKHETTKKKVEMSEEERDHLITFLAKLKLKTEDRQMTNRELKDMLLPPDFTIDGEYLLELNEFTSICQTELGLPITKPEQLLLLDEYGVSNTTIDAQKILADAGMWEDGGTTNAYRSASSSPARRRAGREWDFEEPSPERKDNHGGLDSLEVSPVNNPSKFETLKPPRGKEPPGRRILDETNATLAELKDLHSLVEEEFDGVVRDKAMDELTNRQLQAQQQALEHENQLLESMLSQKKEEDSQRDKTTTARSRDNNNNDSSNKQNDKQSQQQQSSNTTLKDKNPLDIAPEFLQNDKIRQLVEENKRLKGEVEAFDSNFFEELEDLKYRYSRLQEMIGEDPFLDDSISRSLQIRHDRRQLTGQKTVGALPLNRLSWAAKSSMRAIDHASYDSPLVQGRRALGMSGSPPRDRRGASSTSQSSRSLSPTRLARERATRERPSFVDLDDAGLNRRSVSPGPLFGSSSASGLYLPNMTGGGGGGGGNSRVGPNVVVDGGVHGIGEGRYALLDQTEVGGSFANLCERRLVFELSSHPRPAEVTSLLIHKVTDTAGKNKAKDKDAKADAPTYISVPQLIDIIGQIGLGLTSQEIQVLASGFASDGKGGIDSYEFCEMIRSLVYNLIGHHHRHGNGGSGDDFSDSWTRGRTGRNSTRKDINKEKEKEFMDEFYRLLKDCCDSIILYDKKAVLGTSKSFFHTLIKPFIEVDTKGSGYVCFHDFKQLLREMGTLLSNDEYRILAKPFAILSEDFADAVPESSYPSSNLNHLEQFRGKQINGLLSSAMKTNGTFDKFMDKHHFKSSVQRQMEPVYGLLDRIVDDTMIDYSAFLQELSRLLDEYVQKKGGLPLTATSASGKDRQLPWIIKEFELVDLLLTQLEAMNSTNRRKTLITLQYSLENADLKAEGELDGFAVLSCLLNAGFKLQRYSRIQLLKAAEVYGGKLEYHRLIVTLLQTAVNWSQTERGLVYKILRSMGNSIEARRLWLAKMKRELMERVSTQKVRSKARHYSSQQLAGSLRTSTNTRKNETTDEELLHLPIPPTIFLHVLRDLHVSLLPDEEAALLDCLDTERLAKLHIKKLTKHSKYHQSHSLSSGEQSEMQQQKIHSLLWKEDDDDNNFGSGNDDFNSLPMVDYYSFLQFVARHCGSWTDSKPELFQLLQKIVASLLHPLPSIQELFSLLTAFDENGSGYISLRSFLVACHRSRFFANIDDMIIQELGETLVLDGVGEIQYRPFILTLRGIHLKVITDKQDAQKGQAGGMSSIIQQLLENATDPDTMSLVPLRNYFLSALELSALQSLLIPMRDFQRLLREFSIVYQAGDFEALLMEVSVDYRLSAEEIEDQQLDPSESAIDPSVRMIDVNRLMRLLMAARPPWYERNISLAKKLLVSMNKLSKGREAAVEDLLPTATSQHMTTNQLESASTKLLNRFINRINAFALEDLEDHSQQQQQKNRRSPADIHESLQTNDSMGSSSYQKGRLIEWPIFEYLAKSMGLLLSRADVQFLCDASDSHPECARINPYLLLDLLHVYEKRGGSSNNLDGRDNEDLNEAAIYALNHFQTLLWRAKDIAFANVFEDDPRSNVARKAFQREFGTSLRNDPDFTVTASSRTKSAAASLSSSSAAMKRKKTRATEDQWKMDVTNLFKGFDYLGNGFIDLKDFMLILRLLNLTISTDLLQDIPYINFSHELVNYPRLLEYLLDTSHLTKQQRFALSGPSAAQLRNELEADERGEYDDYLNEFDDLLDDYDGKGNSRHRRSLTKKSTGTNSNTSLGSNGGDLVPRPLQLLINRIRSNISVFIANNHTLEEAWMELLKIFSHFDKLERNLVSSRDFLLCLSVLLTSSLGGSSDRLLPRSSPGTEELLFSKEEWDQILSYFEIEDKSKSNRSNMTHDDDEEDEEVARVITGRLKKKDMQINYLLFCEMVLNIKEIEKKLADINRFTAQKSAMRSRMSSLRPGTSSSSSYHRLREEDGFDEEDRLLREYFADEHLDASRGRLSEKTPLTRKIVAQQRGTGLQHKQSSSTMRSSSASPTRNNSSRRSLAAEDDPIARRFQQSNEKYRRMISSGRDYGHSSASVSSPPKAPAYHMPEYLRSSRTQGATSRDAPKPRQMTTTTTSRPTSAGSLGRSTGIGLGGRESMSVDGTSVSRQELNERKRELLREKQLSGGGSGPGMSSKQLFQSSHSGSGLGTTNKSVRFNWNA